MKFRKIMLLVVFLMGSTLAQIGVTELVRDNKDRTLMALKYGLIAVKETYGTDKRIRVYDLFKTSNYFINYPTYEPEQFVIGSNYFAWIDFNSAARTAKDVYFFDRTSGVVTRLTSDDAEETNLMGNENNLTYSKFHTNSRAYRIHFFDVRTRLLRGVLFNTPRSNFAIQEYDNYLTLMEDDGDVIEVDRAEFYPQPRELAFLNPNVSVILDQSENRFLVQFLQNNSIGIYDQRSRMMIPLPLTNVEDARLIGSRVFYISDGNLFLYDIAKNSFTFLTFSRNIRNIAAWGNIIAWHQVDASQNFIMIQNIGDIAYLSEKNNEKIRIDFHPGRPVNWVDLHYRINRGTEVNVRLNSIDQYYLWEVKNMRPGDNIDYYFTYQGVDGTAVNSQTFYAGKSGVPYGYQDHYNIVKIYTYPTPAAEFNFWKAEIKMDWVDLHYKVNSGKQYNYRMLSSPEYLVNPFIPSFFRFFQPNLDLNRSSSTVDSSIFMDYFYTYSASGAAYDTPWLRMGSVRVNPSALLVPAASSSAKLAFTGVSRNAMQMDLGQKRKINQVKIYPNSLFGEVDSVVVYSALTSSDLQNRTGSFRSMGKMDLSTLGFYCYNNPIKVPSQFLEIMVYPKGSGSESPVNYVNGPAGINITRYALFEAYE